MEIKTNNINKLNNKFIEAMILISSINILKKMDYIDTQKAKKSIVQIYKITQ